MWLLGEEASLFYDPGERDALESTGLLVFQLVLIVMVQFIVFNFLFINSKNETLLRQQNFRWLN